MMTEDFAAFMDTDEFAQSVTVNYANVNVENVSVNGIFEREFVAVSVGRVDIEGFKPVFTCATSDVFEAAEGDQVVIGSDTYEIVLNMPDGTGISKLILKK